MRHWLCLYKKGGKKGYSDFVIVLYTAYYTLILDLCVAIAYIYRLCKSEAIVYARQEWGSELMFVGEFRHSANHRVRIYAAYHEKQLPHCTMITFYLSYSPGNMS